MTFIRILKVERIDAYAGACTWQDVILTTACADHVAFKALPREVALQGHLFSKTGWNSDHGEAYYKNSSWSDPMMARSIR